MDVAQVLRESAQIRRPMRPVCTRTPLSLLALAMSLVLGSACERDGGNAAGDGDGSGGVGRIRVNLTDAALDDPDVQTVYVTVTGITLDGEELPNLTERRTIDISNYTAGRTIQYGNDQPVSAGTYDGLELTLDLGRSESGEAPGAYVVDREGARLPLDYGPATVTIPAAGAFAVTADEVTELILDLDLRRAIGYRDGGGYTFGSDGQLARSLRLVEEGRSGAIEGTVVNHAATVASDVARVVYAFPRGTVTADTLRRGYFGASVSSARVSPGGRFRLSYLPTGRYELVAVDYADVDGDGRADLVGARRSDGEIGAETRAVTVSALAQTTIEMIVGEGL